MRDAGTRPPRAWGAQTPIISADSNGGLLRRTAPASGTSGFRPRQRAGRGPSLALARRSRESWPEPHSYRSASIGSRRDALKAGKRPKKMPTPPEKANPMANDHHGIDTGSGVNVRTLRPTPAPIRQPRTPPDRGEHDRLEQELPEDLAPPRAERLADADLARPLGHRDHHDRHDADAADHQGDRRDDDERQVDRAGRLVEELHRHVLRGDVEVARLVQLQPVPDAHHVVSTSRIASSRGTPSCGHREDL